MAVASVLIVGAGPTGLVLALWLTKQGVAVRIIDKAAEAGTSSRALAVHARTMELYRQLRLDEVVTAKGYTTPGARLWVAGEEKARVPFEEIVSDLTPYGFLHIFPQDEHERLLIDRLEQMGGEVERSMEFLGYSEGDGYVTARLRTADGLESEVQAAFIAGCDGARSAVRHAMGSGYPGGTYPEIFYVADVTGHGPAFNGDLNVELEEADFLAIFPLAHKSRIRLIGAIRPEEQRDIERLTFADISDRATKSLKLEVDQVNWFSTYHVHHRVTDRFRKGRAFLLGDAAHIHTPVGGQGMNTGVGDAINLAWKLKTVLDGTARDSLLDTYEAERRAFALRLVRTTDRAFTVASSDGRLAGIIRTRLLPAVLPRLVKLRTVRNYIFRTVSQITLNYRGKGLDEGRVGSVRGGDRLPWTKLGNDTDNNDTDNYAAFEQIGWQVHVYGEAQPALRSWCDDHQLALKTFRWIEPMRKAGLCENALYLLRPDTYVALAQTDQSVASLDRYFEKIGVQLRF
jgi:2-polyprenyl-6-methoxyphenol hydroxylase-like FAD-dependent oxidoreductase